MAAKAKTKPAQKPPAKAPGKPPGRPPAAKTGKGAAKVAGNPKRPPAAKSGALAAKPKKPTKRAPKGGAVFDSGAFSEVAGMAAELLGDEQLPDLNSSPEALLAMISAKGREINAISSNLQGGGKMVDNQVSIYKTLVIALMALVPTSLSAYSIEPKVSNAQAVSSLINQLKENMMILAALERQDDKAASITDNIVGPALMQVAQHMIASSIGVQTAINSAKLRPEQAKAIKSAMDKMLTDHAIYLNGVNGMIGEQIFESIAGVARANAEVITTAAKSTPISQPKKKAPAAKKAKASKRKTDDEDDMFGE